MTEEIKSDELKRQRAELLAEARQFVDTWAEENRDPTTDERTHYDDLVASADSFDPKIEQAERDEAIAAREARFKASRGPTMKPQPNEGAANLGMEDKEVRQYSFTKAILACASGDWKEAGLEREASTAMSKKMGKEPRGAMGFFVPHDVIAHRDLDRRDLERRDLTKGTGSAGGFTVDTLLLGDSFIDLLRNRVVVARAGATMLTGLVGDIAIPRQSAAASISWVAENTAVTESQQVFEQVAMSAKSAGVFTDISRKLLLQSSIDVEAFVRADLAQVLAIGIDLAALHGTGAANQPSGLAVISGVANVDHGANGGAPTWAKVVEFETAIASANADMGSLAYVTNAKVRGKAKTVEKATNTGLFLWGEGAMPVNGYPAFVSNQVRSDLTDGTGTALSAEFFGNWNDLFIGMWGGLDVLVDPYTGGTAGTLRVIVFQDVDIAVRHPESFARALDIITT